MRNVETSVGTLSRVRHFAVGLRTSLSAQDKKYDPGASDTEIRIGNTAPYSGPASSLSVMFKVVDAYFRKLNDEGGINGRKLKFISYDDAYSPPKTVEQTRKLVEGDEVLLMFGSLGSPTNAAVQKYLNAKKVPQLFIMAAATRFGNPAEYPWTMLWPLDLRSEGQIAAAYLEKTMSAAKVAVIYQNDDFGRDVLSGFKQGLGERKIRHRHGDVLRDHRSHHRLRDRQGEVIRCGRPVRDGDAEILRDGDPPRCRARLEADHHGAAELGLDRRGAVARGPGEFDRRHPHGRRSRTPPTRSGPAIATSRNGRSS